MPDTDVAVGDEKEFDIQIIDDVEPPPKKTPKADDDDEDYGEYSAKVQRRIAKEVKKRRDAERERDAERTQRTSYEQQLRQAGNRIDKVDQQAVDAEDRRIAAEIAKAQKEFVEARENGNVNAESIALTQIAELKADKKALDLYKVDRKLPQRQETEQPQQQQAKPRLAPRAEEWKRDNKEWFEDDTPAGRRMTTMAYAIDQELAEEGFDLNTEEYYAELTNRIHKVFPDYFKKQPSKSQPVAEVTRTLPSRKTVRLTASQVATARSLGVKPEDYARFVRNEDDA